MLCRGTLTAGAQGAILPSLSASREADALNKHQQRVIMRRTVFRTFVGYLMLALIPLLSTVLFGGVAWAAIVVDCNKPGHTITHALTFAKGTPITIEVSGTCHENVVIGVSNVTLTTTSGATIAAPDVTKAAIAVEADGVVIDGFTITGGASGVFAVGAQRLSVEHCIVEGAAHNGFVLQQASAATIDNCIVRANSVHGISIVRGSGVTVTNSTISENRGRGIAVNNGGHASIGISLNNQLAGNQITNNRADGIGIGFGASADIGGNTISGNGAQANQFGQSGIIVNDASAVVVGGNTISGNAQFGILLKGAHVDVGDAAFGLGSANSITGNGQAGILVFLGSTLDLRNATVSNNKGPGLQVGLRSTVWSNFDTNTHTTINGNSGDGVLLSQGSAASFINQVTVSGNGGFGLNCLDAKSSFAGATSGITGNSKGNISPGCTGF